MANKKSRTKSDRCSLSVYMEAKIFPLCMWIVSELVCYTILVRKRESLHFSEKKNLFYKFDNFLQVSSAYTRNQKGYCRRFIRVQNSFGGIFFNGGDETISGSCSLLGRNCPCHLNWWASWPSGGSLTATGWPGPSGRGMRLSWDWAAWSAWCCTAKANQ